MIEDRIYQCVAVVSGSRVYDHPFGFVYHKDILIFIQDIQRDIFREDIHRLRIRDLYTDLVSCTHLIICPDRIPVYKDSSIFYEFLDIRTGNILKIPA